MVNGDYFKNKKVTVVGLARSGFASASLLADLGAQVSVTDQGQNESIRAYSDKLKIRNISIELGKHTREFILGRDLIVLSPGVDNRSGPVLWAEGSGIPIISEIELAWRLCPATVIAVTGTNGKTTVTTLIGKILEAAGKKVFVCGNIGNPFSGLVSSMGERDFVSLEVSSFQLERIDRFKPKISLILNFNQNHLDRHKDMEEYLSAKKRIFKNQDKDDYLVLNADYPMLKNLAEQVRARVVYFNSTGQINPNYAAVLAVSDLLGLEKKKSQQVLSDFKGVEHRLEYVGELNGVEFINDSKATTVDSTIWALNNISRPVILIAGGRDKGLDYTLLSRFITDKVKEVILIGEAKEKIKKAIAGLLPVKETGSLENAVRLAWEHSAPGESILLSPMCASFDMFANFEERGNTFKQIVQELIEGAKVKTSS